MQPSVNAPLKLLNAHSIGALFNGSSLFFEFLYQVQIQSSNQNHFAEAGICSVTVAIFVLCCGDGGVSLQFDIGAGARFKDT